MIFFMLSYNQYCAVAKSLDVVGERWTLLIVRELATVVRELGRWGVQLMGEQGPNEAFESHWLTLPVKLFLHDRDPEQGPVTIEVQTGAQPVFLKIAGCSVDVLHRQEGAADVTVTGDAPQILRLLSGRASIAQARRHGVRVKGSIDALTRVLPHAPVQVCGLIGWL